MFLSYILTKNPNKMTEEGASNSDLILVGELKNDLINLRLILMTLKEKNCFIENELKEMDKVWIF